MTVPKFKIDEFVSVAGGGLYRAAVQRLLGRGPGYRDGIILLNCLACLPPDRLAALLEWVRKENGTHFVPQVSGPARADATSADQERQPGT